MKTVPLRSSLISSFCLTLLLAWSVVAEARLSHDFPLVANDKIQARCQTPEGNATSKLKLILNDQSSRQALVQIRLKACTTSYGYQEINLNLAMPSDWLDLSDLGKLSVGKTVTYTVDNQQISLTLDRKANAQMNLRVGRIANIPKMTNLRFVAPTSPDALKRYKGGSQALIPWTAISFEYAHPIAGTFVFRGNLNEVQAF